MAKRQLRWLKLDNAAKIYPAAKRRDWSNVFRLSVTLNEKIDPKALQQALANTVKRFPSIAVRVRRGVFWYYLEEIESPPKVIYEYDHPLTHMPFDDILKCAIRVLYYQNRIAVEFFHAVADGNGGMIFLKSLAAEYLELVHKVKIPYEYGVLDRNEPVNDKELADDFLKYAGKVKKSRTEATAFQLKGRREENGFKNIVIAELDADKALEKARSYNVTLTEFMTAVMIKSFMEIQEERVEEKKRRPIKALVPANLRRMFPSDSLRNFVLYVTPGIDPRLGSYSFDEILKEVHHQMELELTPKRMSARIYSNVKMEQMLILKILPLFIKNIGMKIAYNLNGEKKSCITISNLGVIKLPKEMDKYVEQFGFTLGVQHTSPNNCAMLSYDGKLYIAMIRGIKEPVLEHRFIMNLKEMGLKAKLSSNSRRSREEK
ncbi:MAG: hypothetical protein LUE12_00200 [Ruminococcus sp.]|nr:hypothetical protein [Ruminococcus sp.]